MPSHPPPSPNLQRLPRWVLFVGPLAAVIVSNADVVLLEWTHPHILSGELALASALSVSLSLAICAVTLWFLWRLSREIDQRLRTESELRAALAQRSDALAQAHAAQDDLAHALDRERLLRRELDHRVRNNLSALLGLVGIYESSDTTPADAAGSLRGKILALREAYALISSSHGDGVALEPLLRKVIGTSHTPADAHRISYDGPPTRLAGRDANAIAMIAQELITNAYKHGVLRPPRPRGTIRIAWSPPAPPAPRAPTARSESPATPFQLLWTETHDDDAPLPSPPTTPRGIGLDLIEGLARSDLRGSIEVTREPRRWSVRISGLLTPAPPPLAPEPEHAGAQPPNRSNLPARLEPEVLA